MNATDHALLKNNHRADDEKRIIVILPESHYTAWLEAPVDKSMDFIRHYPHGQLMAAPVPLKPSKTKQQADLI